jgi:hypothetical protein
VQPEPGERASEVDARLGVRLDERGLAQELVERERRGLDLPGVEQLLRRCEPLRGSAARRDGVERERVELRGGRGRRLRRLLRRLLRWSRRRRRIGEVDPELRARAGGRERDEGYGEAGEL